MTGGRTQRRRAFTLVELLVVMTIIGVMLAFSSPLWMAQSTTDLNGSSLRLAGFFEEARGEAAAWGEPVRVLVHDDPAEPSRFRQRIIALRQSTNPASGAVTWEPVLHPLVLPEGIYFDSDHPGVSEARMNWADSGQEPVSWRYYQVGPDGAPDTPSPNVVIGKGFLDGGGSQLRFPNPEQVAGFRLSHRTRPIHFRSREDILESID